MITASEPAFQPGGTELMLSTPDESSAERENSEKSNHYRSDRQDVAYLAELLLSKGYEVQGVKRRSSLLTTNRIDHLYQDPAATIRGIRI